MLQPREHSAIAAQIELALAYGCVDSVGSEKLVQYIHHNRDSNSKRIETMGKQFYFSNSFKRYLILLYYLIFFSKGKTFEGLKAEIKEKVAESLTEQQSKIVNNTKLISTLGEVVGTNQADVSDLETKMEEQKSETRELIGGVFGQGCISCGILVSGIRARGVSSEHMENMEMFSCSPT